MRSLALYVACLVFSVFLSVDLFGQEPQFAVVRPSGETFICPSWDSAYSIAVDGDYLYLPNVSFSDTIFVNKSLHIYGLGHHPDSTGAVGRTIFKDPLYILSGASNGHIEGLDIEHHIYLGDANKLTNFTIKRVKFIDLHFVSTSPDSLPENISIVECIFNSSHVLNSLLVSNILFRKNIINWVLYNIENSTFDNNVFLRNSYTYGPLENIATSTFKNNIFRDPSPCAAQGDNNIFYNNLTVGVANFEPCANIEQNNVSETSIEDVFAIDPGLTFSYDDDLHLLPSCVGLNAGTDGTDVGIYGTNSPTPEGWVPSNPHIYFKQIDGETGSDGKLHIQVGVRTGN